MKRLMTLLLFAVPVAAQWQPNDPTHAQSGNIYYTGGSVGIGTTSPQDGVGLDVVSTSQNSYFRSTSPGGYSRLFVTNDAGGGFYMLSYGSSFSGTSTFGPPNAGLTLLLGTSNTNGLVVGTNALQPIIFSVHGSDNMHIDSTGNVGIGTPNPTAKLHVDGNAIFTGTVTGGNIKAKYQDVAEWVPSGEDLHAGTVVVINPAARNGVIASTRSYDTTVAGVVSVEPGISLGDAGTGKTQVATLGRVKVRVDATNAPIATGDLLVTSDAPGTAMKSEPVVFASVSIHRPGTIIGKALEPLATGKGEILVLLTLQ